MTGLYDIHGVLRYSGRDPADCLAYADFFALNPGTYTLASLERSSDGAPGGAAVASLSPAVATLSPADGMAA